MAIWNWAIKKGASKLQNNTSMRAPSDGPSSLEHSRKLARHDVTVDFMKPLLWPLNSPDVNSVDYKVWSVLQVLKERVYRSQIREVEHLKVRLVEEWRMFSQNIVDTEVKQWRFELKALVKSAGGHFEYKLSRARCTQ